MKLYTSYFGNLTNLPPKFVPISICLKSPDWYKGIQYKQLAPYRHILRNWKNTHDEDYYEYWFTREVLIKLDANKVVNDLMTLSNDNPVVLLCYELPTDFCHRHLVSNWFIENGYMCKEYMKDIDLL